MYIKNFFSNIYLGRSNLIEASAGTGKTNLISLLYLRFLLGINTEKLFSNLFINNILVVTFTDLAVLEIKNRILDNIKNLRISCIKNYPINNIIKEIYFCIKNKSNVIDLLTKYEYYIDNISIFTIHSFCKKIIYSNFIESSIDCNNIIIDNENSLIYELIIIFWRKYFSCLSTNIIKIICSYWSNPSKLFNFLLPVFNIINFNFNEERKYLSIEDCYNKIIVYINKIKKLLLINYNIIYDFFFFKKKIFSVWNLKRWFLEIKSWCNKETIDFYIPSCLKKFSLNFLLKKNIIINFNYIYIFKFIDGIFLKTKDLRNFTIIFCISFIKKKLVKLKKKKLYLSFNDLIIKLNQILIEDKKSILINIIRKNFPILLIDEYQDTDFLQFNIFNKIYLHNYSKFSTKLILLGDPKQSIYSFRGANIFNYIKSKKNIDFFYTLDKNWRSSIKFIKSINYLFSRINNVFVFKEIKYLKVSYSKENNFFLIKNDTKLISSINFSVFNNLKTKNFKISLAKACAIQIVNVLDKNNNFFLVNNNIRRLLIPSDIAILVHTNYEVSLIFNALQEFNLPINSILEKSNVFHTYEAKELFFLLKSILFPESCVLMSSALSTSFFDFNLINIKNIINNEFLLNKFINDFYFYKNIWNENGILVMIKYILKKNKNKNIFLKIKDKLWLNNILHISEILEKKYFKIKSKKLLLFWFNDSIINNTENKEEYYIRSSYNKNGIKISTIHKSKGLQYNVVWLPFLINFKINNFYFFFHNRKNYRVNIDLYKLKKNKFLVDEEIYSEEMRLFYVAITRCIYQCNIFIYELNVKNKNFCFTYLGRLIGYNKKYFFNDLKNIITSYFNFKYIYFNFFDIIYYLNFKKYFLNKNYITNDISKFFFYKNKRFILNFSKITSNKFIKNNYIYTKNFIYKKKNNYFLPKGKKIGNFFHKILEKINFLNLLDNNTILYYMLKFNILKKWFFFIKNILFNVLNVNLTTNNICLSNKKISFLYKEFDFFLPIKKFNFKKFMIIFQKYDCILKWNKNIIYNKNNFEGFFNGIIDLIFFYKNKYFIVDYKTNWLGYDYINYRNNILYKYIYLHNYNVQYILYSIALHNYLKINVINYNYNNNFGGIYYIFLRGLFLDNNRKSFTGIFYTRPNFLLINKLSMFFKKK